MVHFERDGGQQAASAAGDRGGADGADPETAGDCRVQHPEGGRLGRQQPHRVRQSRTGLLSAPLVLYRLVLSSP